MNKLQTRLGLVVFLALGMVIPAFGAAAGAVRGDEPASPDDQQGDDQKSDDQKADETQADETTGRRARHGAGRDLRHRPKAHRERAERAGGDHHARRRRLRADLGRRRRRTRPVGTGAQLAARVVVRPHLSALLHPRSRQHGLRPQRLATGVRGLRRGGAGEPGAQGSAGMGHRAHRSAARAAGDAVRAQHAGRHRQVRLGQAVARARRLHPPLLRHLRHRRAECGRRRPARPHAVGPRLRPAADPGRLDRQPLHRPEERPRRLRLDRLSDPVPVAAERGLQRPAEPPRLGPRRYGARLPRQHPAAGDERPGERLPPGRGVPGRPQRAERHRAGGRPASSSTGSAPAP